MVSRFELFSNRFVRRIRYQDKNKRQREDESRLKQNGRYGYGTDARAVAD